MCSFPFYFFTLLCFVGSNVQASNRTITSLKVGSNIPSDWDLMFEPIYSKNNTPKGLVDASIAYNMTLTGTWSDIFLVIAPRDQFSSRNITCKDGHVEVKSNSGVIIVPDPSNTTANSTDPGPTFPDSTLVLAINSTTSQFAGSLMVNRTTLYSWTITACGKSVDAKVDGSMIFKSPYGMIPGHIFSNIFFHTWTSVIFTVSTMLWVVICLHFTSTIHEYHWYICGILILSMAESITSAAEGRRFNSTGSRAVGLFVISQTCSVIRELLGRVLLVYMCAGALITRPKLPRSFRHLLLVYCAAFGGLDAFTRYYVDAVFVPNFYLYFDFMLLTLHLTRIAFDACLVYVVLRALARTMNTLADFDEEKRSLYEYLRYVVIGACAVGAGYVIYDLDYVVRSGYSVDVRWRNFWLVSGGFWSIVSTGCMMAFLVIWKPSELSHLYTYSTIPAFVTSQLVDLDTVQSGLSRSSYKLQTEEKEEKHSESEERKSIHSPGPPLVISSDSDNDAI
eukprot:185743_1